MLTLVNVNSSRMLQTFRRCLRSRRHSLSIPVLILFMCILLLTITILLEPPQHHIFTSVRLKIFGTEISCYRDHSLGTLPDIEDLQSPDPGNSIFFHETSCRSYNAERIIISGRQACAVESAARLHPERKVYLLFTSPGEIEPNIGDEADLSLTALQTYDNIYMGHIDFEKYINNTPLEHLYTHGSIELSRYAGSHASDVLRYLTLWKYGGLYLDLDVVVTKSLDSFGNNYAGKESATNIAAGVLSFAAEGQGHSWAQECLQDLSESFSGHDWGNNGPGVITRLLQRLCHANRADEMKPNCDGFQVMPYPVFYPIPWVQWFQYFDPQYAKNVTEFVTGNSYIIHVWNKISQTIKVHKESAYSKIAKHFCPRVYEILLNMHF